MDWRALWMARSTNVSAEPGEKAASMAGLAEPWARAGVLLSRSPTSKAPSMEVFVNRMLLKKDDILKILIEPGIAKKISF